MFQSLGLLLLSCFFLTVESQQDKVLPPQNVNLVWENGFQPRLSWEPPQPNCSYTVTTEILERHSLETHRKQSSPCTKYRVMEGGFMELTVQTVCNGKSSEKVTRRVRHPVLINNLHCYTYANEQVHCSWSPAIPDLEPKFFYRLVPLDFSQSVDDKPSAVVIKECSSYTFTKGVRTGCNLKVDNNTDIHVLFNGMLNNTLAWNTFKQEPFKDVRLPALDWTVTKSDDKFNISWDYPDIQGSWKFDIRYTECTEENKKKDGKNQTSAVLDLLPHCEYRIRIQGLLGNSGGTEWSEEKYFAASVDPAAWVYAAIILPLVFAGLAILIVVCCRKNKDIIFPKVPVPRDFLSDISDNNNKISVRNLYIPTEEEENCKITLVQEP